MIPLLIDLKDKEVLVVGGGKIAKRRIESLLEEGAKVTCISLSVPEEFRNFDSKNFWLVEKKYEPTDLAEMDLVIAATNHDQINERIKRDCEKLKILCSRVDCHDDSDVIFPAVIRRGRLTLSVSTQGASPSLTKEIAGKLAKQYDESYIEKLDLLSIIRKKILAENNSDSDKILREMAMCSVSELREKLAQGLTVKQNK